MKTYHVTLVVRDRFGKTIGAPIMIGKPFIDRLACEQAIEELSRDETTIERYRKIVKALLHQEFTLTTEMQTIL